MVLRGYRGHSQQILVIHGGSVLESKDVMLSAVCTFHCGGPQGHPSQCSENYKVVSHDAL